MCIQSVSERSIADASIPRGAPNMLLVSGHESRSHESDIGGNRRKFLIVAWDSDSYPEIEQQAVSGLNHSVGEGKRDAIRKNVL